MDKEKDINDFQYKLNECSLGKLTKGDIAVIKERLEWHKECQKDNPEAIVVTVYAGGVNVSLECLGCNSVVYDSDIMEVNA